MIFSASHITIMDDKTEKIFQWCQQIDDAKSQENIQIVLKEIKKWLNATGLVFLFYAESAIDSKQYRYINESPQDWCEAYDNNMSYLIDPCIQYAQQNSDPVLIENLSIYTQGQKHLLNNASSYGFINGFVVPVFSPPEQSKYGILYVGSSVNQYSESFLSANKYFLIVLATALLRWWNRRTKDEVVCQTNINKKEIELLRLTHLGYRSIQIAEMFGESKSAIDQKLHRITKKFKVDSKKTAGWIAYQSGLFFHA